VNETLSQFIEDGTFNPQDCLSPIEEKDVRSLADKIREFDAVAQEFV